MATVVRLCTSGTGAKPTTFETKRNKAKETMVTTDIIYARCQTVLKEGHRRTLKQWKTEQLTLSELEFEWIRQVRRDVMLGEGVVTARCCWRNIF